MESGASSTGDDSRDGLYNFSLAERYAYFSDEELERRADEEADAEAASSAYEGIPLSKERIKAGLLGMYRDLRADTPPSPTLLPSDTPMIS